jgi:hypothetical protein
MPGDTIEALPVIEQMDATTLLFPGDRATVDPYLNLDSRDRLMSIDPITLEIMSNGFKSIADETYIAPDEERLLDQHQGASRPFDAIIDPAGRLIVQARIRSRFISAR